MPASLEIGFVMMDGSEIEYVSPMTDENVTRFVTWAIEDKQSVPPEYDDSGAEIPRSVPWALKRLTSMFLVDVFGKVAMWEHQKAVASVQSPTPIPIVLENA